MKKKSNLVYRVRLGSVVDFLDFSLGSHSLPAFNLADTGITVGAVLLVLDSLFVRQEKHKFDGGEETGEGQ